MILRDLNSEVEAISSHLGFSPLSIKCLFVCGQQEVKRGAGCQVSECCKEGLGHSRGLFMFWQIWEWGWLNSKRLPTPFDFSSLLFPFARLHFQPLRLVSLSVFLQSSPFLTHFLNYCFSFFFSHSLNFSFVDFSHCLLFLSLCLLLSSPSKSVMLDVSCCQLLHVSPLICPALLMSYPYKRLLSWAWCQPG